MIAEILHRVTAIPAIAVDAADPRDACARAQWQFRRSTIDDFAHDLMPRDHSQLFRRQLSFHDMKVGATHAACADAQQNMTGPDARICDVSDLEGAL
jgi:hypothetical protein